MSRDASDAGLTVRFWGVRGSVPCAGARWLRYGGNTSCIEVRHAGGLLIFDAGTGLIRLGETLAGPIHAHLFLTHTHVDHIQGLPFFRPLFDPRSSLRIGAGHLGRERSVRDALATYMVSPLFPVPPEIFAASVDYWDFAAGDLLELDGALTIRTQPLNHPDGATGYRVEKDGRSLCYVTDTEHIPDRPDQAILELIDGADVVVYDSTYTDAEMDRYRGWGHSTWQEGARLCDAARVGTLVVFHHEPTRDDDALDVIAAEAAARRPGTVLAREGMGITLRPDGVEIARG